MGLKLTGESGSDGDISVYFGKGVTQQEQVIFANYIHAHLQTSCEQAQRLRHYVCPKCHAPKGNPEVLMKKLLREKQNADTECDNCGELFPLWDALEKKFASEAVRAQVEQLQTDDLAKLDTRRRGKLLALEVGARITSADQKCFEIPATEDEGLDMELEFTNDDGEGTGRRLYLQLKSGNSHLTKRKTDGAEIFHDQKAALGGILAPAAASGDAGDRHLLGRRRAGDREGQAGIRRRALDGDHERAQARKPEWDEAGEADRVQRRAAGPEQRAEVAGAGAGGPLRSSHKRTLRLPRVGAAAAPSGCRHHRHDSTAAN